MAVKTVSYQVEWKPSASWVDITSSVYSVEDETELTASQENPIAFGDASESRCSIEASGSLASTAWQRIPIRITFTVDGVSTKAFTGIVTSRRRTLDTLIFECESVTRKIAKTKRYSLAYYRRPIATKTHATSVEDPTNANYAGGIINWALWQAGGRPNEQAGTYTNADFYYSCEHALLAPDWSWIAGEDGWESVLEAARAAGGQLYVDRDGVVRYKQPLSFAAGTATYTFTASVFGDIEEQTRTSELATKVICPFLPRVARPMQDVVEDSTPRLIEASGSLTIVLEPELPLKTLELTGTQLKPEAIQAIFFDGSVVPQGAGGYTHTVTALAQSVTIVVTNATTRPFVINRIILRGEPIAKDAPGQAVAGSGTVEFVLNDNPFVQTKAHAQRLADMVLAFYGSARAVRTLSGCPYDPDRYVGETVLLTVASGWGMTAEPHVIIAKRDSETGAVSDYDLASVTGLPITNDYYQVGTTSYAGQSLKLGW